MDTKFRAMLVEAEKIRAECVRTGNIGPHARQMADMIDYGRDKGLFGGNIQYGTASDEFLAHATEMAACSLEAIYGEVIGSMLELTGEKKSEIRKRAFDKAKTKIEFVRKYGVAALPEYERKMRAKG